MKQLLYTSIYRVKHLAVRTLALVLCVAMVSLMFPASVAQAAFNPQINYQGKLVDSTNVTVADGTYHMRFKLYTVATGGSEIWSEDRSTAAGDRVTVTSGLFSVMLGSSTALTSVDFNQTLYLGVEIGGSSGSPSWDGEMTPRKILGAVPAAFEADRLDHLSSEQFLRSDAVNSTSTATTFLTVTQNGAGGIASFLGPNSFPALSVLSTGRVGIGTTSPYAALSVVGEAVAAYFTATTSTASVFPYASTTALTVSGTLGLTLGTLNGPLQANNGAVSATTSIGVLYGGTGLTTAPSYGNLLVGNASGGYTLTATSSLKIALSDTVGILSVAKGGTGVGTFGGTNTLLYTTAADTLASITTGNSSILVTDGSGVPSWSTTLPAHTLGGDITGNSKSITGLLNITVTGTSNATSSFSTGGLTVGTNQFLVQQTSGRVGIGITNPTAQLTVVGTAVSGAAVNALTVTGGTGSTGGGVTLTAGSGTSGTASNGGAVSITAGSATTHVVNANSGAGGDITLTAGTGGDTCDSGCGAAGNVTLRGGRTYSGAGGIIKLWGGGGDISNWLDLAGATVGKVDSDGDVTFGTFTASSTSFASTFPYASTTALTVSGTLGLTLGTLNGPLQANNGAVSATTSIGVLYGGTGLTSAPAYGNLLVGNASGGYTLTATSSLKIALSDTTGILGVANGGTGVSSFGGTNSLLYTTSANTLSSITTGNSSILVTDGSGVPSWSTTLPAHTLGGAITGNSQTITGLSQLSVGTTTPNNLADFYSTTKAAIGFSGASGSDYKWTIGMDVSNGGRFSIASSTALGTTDRFVIDGAGNVGIGVTAPVADLHVLSTGEQLRLAYDSTNYSKFTVGSASGLTATPGVNGATAFNFTQADGASSVFNIDTTNKRVGIGGATAPATSLDVLSSGTTLASFESTANDRAMTRFRNSSGYMYFGINTTAGGPTTGNAYVYYDSNASTRLFSIFNSGMVVVNDNGGAYNAGKTQYGTLTVNALTSGTVGMAIVGASGQTSDLFKILNSSGSTLGTFTASGSLGIGTSSPIAKLSVNGVGGESNTFLFVVASSTAAYATTTHFSVSATGTVAFRNGEYIHNGTNGQLTFGSTGNSIGDCALNADLGSAWQYGVSLSVSGSGDCANIRFLNALTLQDATSLYLSGSASAGFVNSTSGGSSRYVLDIGTYLGGTSNQSGLIRIGQRGNLATNNTTNSPESIVAQPRLRLMPAAAGTGTYLDLYSDNSNNQIDWKAGNLVFATTTIGAAKHIILGTSTTWTSVGVGTTSPWRGLSVRGTVGLSSSLTSATTGNYLCINTATYEVTSGTTCSASSERFKENILPLAYGLAAIDRLAPVSFTYRPQYDPNGRVRLGFIAEQVLPILPEVVNFDDQGLPESVDYAKLAPVLVSAIQDISKRIDVIDAPRDRASIVINDLGNVGIGDTEQHYKLNVAGETHALGFSVLADQARMLDTTHLQVTDYDAYLTKIKNMSLSTYRYDTDNATTTRLGIAPSDAPIEILTARGDIDLYKLAVFTLGGVKAQQIKIDTLTDRVTAIEQQLASGTFGLNGNGTTTPSTISVDGVLSALEQLGVRITQAVTYVKGLFAETLTLGSPERPSGVTLYDELTGHPYCLKITGGITVAAAGACQVREIVPINPITPPVVPPVIPPVTPPVDPPASGTSTPPTVTPPDTTTPPETPPAGDNVPAPDAPPAPEPAPVPAPVPPPPPPVVDAPAA